MRVESIGVQAQPLDETAESAPDTAIIVAENLAKFQEKETRLDQLRMSFDEEQKEHAELLREMNALRDMATEQMKQDDANLKKWIALI